MTKEDILGVRVDMGLTGEDVIVMSEHMIKDDKFGHYICTTNPEFVIEAQKDPEFMKIVNESDLSVPDGVGVVAATEYLKQVGNLKHNLLFVFKAFLIGMGIGIKTICGNFNDKKVTGVSLAEKLFKLSAEKKYSIFLLGGWPKDWLGRKIDMKEDFATITAEVVRKKYPGVNIIGSTSQFLRDEVDDEKTLNYIHDKMDQSNIKSVDIIMVAYNQNKQERWIVRNSNKIPAHLSIGIGGTFDYIAGHYKQVPTIMTRMSLDWLFRLITQPFRIRRIINAFPIFPFKIFLHSIKQIKH